MTVVKLGDDRKCKTSTKLTSRTRWQFDEQYVISGIAPDKIPKDFTSHDYVASNENDTAKWSSTVGQIIICQHISSSIARYMQLII